MFPLRILLLAAALPILWLAAAPPSRGINIVPVFNATNNETPLFDLFNEGIQDLFAYAENYYEDIFPDPGHTLTLNYWYQDLSGGTLGLFSNSVVENGRVVEATLRIDTHDADGNLRDWYIDAVPESDSEFELESTHWGNVLTSNLDWRHGGNVPNQFEIGYRGSAVSGGPAFGKRDMLSTVLHEFGHALGIRGGAPSISNDGYYAFDSDFLFGGDLEAGIDSDEDGPDKGHMRYGSLLMCGGCGAQNVRRRPSHADLVAMATSQDYTLLDLPRRELLGGGDFNFADAWSGGRAPDPDDDAFVRTGELVVVSVDDIVHSLTVSGGRFGSTTLATGDHSLFVVDKLTVGEADNFTGGILVVGQGGLVSSAEVQIDNTGELKMAGGTLQTTGDFRIASDGTTAFPELSGFGTINVGGTLRSVGAIRAEAGLLTLSADSINLDVSDNPAQEGTVVDAIAGSITFNGPHTDAYDHRMNIGFAQLVTMSHSWTLGAAGRLNITDGGLINNGGSWTARGTLNIAHTVPFGIVGVGGTAPVILAAESVTNTSGVVDFVAPTTIGGTVNVASGRTRLSAGGQFTGFASISISEGASFDLLFDQLYTIQEQTGFQGLGTLFVGEDATARFDPGTTVNTAVENQGRIELGTGAGDLNLDRGLVLTSTAELEISVGGTQQGQTYDHVEAFDQMVTLAGTLDLELLGGFVPQPGDVFEVLTAGAVTGTFDSIAGSNLPGPGSFVVEYLPDAVLLSVISGLPGDYNNDGQVDAADYTVWRDNLGAPSGTLPNDILVGSIGTGQYNTWKMFYGESYSSLASAHPVPEPSAVLLSLCCLLGIVIGKRS